MTGEEQFWLIAITTGVLFCLGSSLIFFGDRRTKAAWDEAAKRLELRRVLASPTSPGEIRGKRDGVTVLVKTVQKGTGYDTSGVSTRYLCHYPTDGPRLTLTKQHSLSFLGGLVGTSDVLIGDPKFDEHVVVATNAPEQAAAFLTSQRKVAILDLFEKYADAKVTERSIEIDVRGKETDPERVVSTLQWLIDISQTLRTPSHE